MTLLLPTGRPNRTLLSACALATIAVIFLTSIPLRFEADATLALARELRSAKIEETGLRVDAIVNFSTLDPDNLFVAHEATIDVPEYPTPSMFDPQAESFTSIELPRMVVRQHNGEDPTFPTQLTLRVWEQQDVALPALDLMAVDLLDGEPVAIVLSEASAELMGVKVGDELQLASDTTSPMVRIYRSVAPPVTVRIAAIVDPVDPSEDVWFGDDSFHEPSQFDTPTGATVAAFGIIPQDAFRSSPWMTEPFFVGRLTQTQALSHTQALSLRQTPSLETSDAWIDEVRRLEATVPDSPVITESVPSTGLGSKLEEVRTARRNSAQALDTSRALFALATAFGVMRLLQQVALGQRRSLAVMRARGASTLQMVGTMGVLGAGLGIVIATAGSVVGRLVTIRAVAPVVDLVQIAAVGALIGAVIGGSFTLARTSQLLDDELNDVELRPSRLQGLVDLLVITLSILAAALWVRGSDNGTEGRNLEMFAVVVMAMTATIVARRLPTFMSRLVNPERLHANLAARQLSAGRSLAPRLADVVVLAIVLIGVSTSLIGRAERTLVDRSWQEAVAPVRVVAALNGAATLNEIEQAAAVDLFASEAMVGGLLAGSGGSVTRRSLLAIDTEAIMSLTSQDPLSPFGSESLAALDASGRIPVLASAEMLGAGGVAIGDHLDGKDALEGLSLVVIGRHHARRLPAPDLVADLRLVEAATGVEATVQAVSLDADADVEALRSLNGLTMVLDRSEILSDLQDRPEHRSLVDGLRLLRLLGAGVALVVIGFGAVLTVEQRRQQSALLDALGTPRRIIGLAVVWEAAASVVIAAVVGTLAAATCIGILMSDGGLTVPWRLLATGSVAVVGCTAVAVWALNLRSPESTTLLGGE